MSSLEERCYISAKYYHFIWQIPLVHYEIQHSITYNMEQKWEALLGPAKVLFWNCFLNLSGTTLLLLKKEWASLNSENSLFPFKISLLEGINSIVNSNLLEYNFYVSVRLQSWMS